MTTTTTVLAIVLAATSALAADPWSVTLVNSSESGKQLKVEPYEVAELVSHAVGMAIFIEKDGERFKLPQVGEFPQLPAPAVIAGPAKFDVRGLGWATFRITPQAMPAWKTLLLPPSTNAVVVSFQVSSNLVDWTSVTNLLFPGVTAPKFFRLRLESGDPLATP